MAKKTGLIEFLAQVRQEVGRVSWPTQRETVVSTAMVLIMVVIASLFFLAVDMVAFKTVHFILMLGSK